MVPTTDTLKAGKPMPPTDTLKSTKGAEARSKPDSEEPHDAAKV